MSLLSIILALAIVGFLCWLPLQIPMPQPFRIGVMILFLVIWVLQALGVVTGLSRLTLK